MESFRDILNDEVKDLQDTIQAYLDRARVSEDQIRKGVSAFVEMAHRNIINESRTKANELFIELRALKRVLNQMPESVERTCPASNLKEE